MIEAPQWKAASEGTVDWALGRQSKRSKRADYSIDRRASWRNRCEVGNMQRAQELKSSQFDEKPVREGACDQQEDGSIRDFSRSALQIGRTSRKARAWVMQAQKGTFIPSASPRDFVEHRWRHSMTGRSDMTGRRYQARVTRQAVLVENRVADSRASHSHSRWYPDLNLVVK